MTTLYDSSIRVKPSRPFATGLSMAARKPYSAADAAWWAAESNAAAPDYVVIGPSDAAIDAQFAEYEALERLCRGYACC